VLVQIAIWCGIGCIISGMMSVFYWELQTGDRALAFVGGALFYGFVAWIVSRPFAIMSRSRRRQRLLERAERYECLKCGYPLKGVARGGICPECGSPPGWVR
jgi:hypothetical protein